MWIRGILLVFPVLKLVIEETFHNGDVVTSTIILLLKLYPYHIIVWWLIQLYPMISLL